MRALPLFLVSCLVGAGFGQTVTNPIAGSAQEICTAAQTAFSTQSITGEQRVQLADALTKAFAANPGPIQCSIATGTGAATLWYVKVDAQTPFTFTSANAPPATVTNWGTTIPIYAGVITYPPLLHDPVRWNWGCTTGFVVFIDRMTFAGVPVNNPNPVTFQVGPIGREVERVVISDSLAPNAALLIASGGQWTQANGGVVSVTSPKGVTFVGCVDDHDSNLGLLGLLGLIAIPVCCCCCLLPLIWWCLRRRRRGVTWCCPQQPCGMQQSCCQPAAVDMQMLPVYQTAGDCPYY